MRQCTHFDVCEGCACVGRWHACFLLPSLLFFLLVMPAQDCRRLWAASSPGQESSPYLCRCLLQSLPHTEGCRGASAASECRLPAGRGPAASSLTCFAGTAPSLPPACPGRLLPAISQTRRVTTQDSLQALLDANLLQLLLNASLSGESRPAASKLTCCAAPSQHPSCPGSLQRNSIEQM